MSCLYAYLKPYKNESDYFVHITVDPIKSIFRIYYHMSWWKKANVSKDIFITWKNGLAKLPLKPLSKKKKRNGLKVRVNSVKHQGKGLVSRRMLTDLFGFVERDTAHHIPAKLEAYVNYEDKIIEVKCVFKYSALGLFPQEIVKLPIFTDNPDLETVKTDLPFFKFEYIIDKPAVDKPRHGSRIEAKITESQRAEHRDQPPPQEIQMDFNTSSTKSFLIDHTFDPVSDHSKHDAKHDGNDADHATPANTTESKD